MNERVKKLAEQARAQVHEIYKTMEEEPIGNFIDWFDEQFEQKFAELIVKECMGLCEKQEYDYWRSSEDQDFTPIDCADAIKEHFGVE